MKNLSRPLAFRPALIASLVLANLAVTSCSDKQSAPTASTSTGTPGKVVIKGSNTIGEELGPRLIAEYKKQHPNADFELESKATGYGLAALLAGRCDIAGASRAPLKEEMEIAQTRHIELNDHVIGHYCVAVIVNSGNHVTNLTRDQVGDIFTGTVKNWKEVGGADAPIHWFIRDPISGTYLGFRELAMENKSYGSGETTFTNYAGIVRAVAQDPDGIGYCSFDLANKEGVKAVSIQGVAPSKESVSQGTYPYSRVLRFYTNKAAESPTAIEFIQFVQSSPGQAVVSGMGFVPKL